MRLAKGELLFVTPVAAVFAAAFILLVAASPASTGIGREMIGTITYKNHFAERKSSAQVMWNALAQSSPVYNGDTIHTTAKSSAVLHLDKQADISLGEETLVRIDVTPKRAEILLDGGIISVRKESSGRELGIATTAGKISMKEGELSAQGEGRQAAGLRRRRPGESGRGDGKPGARDRSEPCARVRSVHAADRAARGAFRRERGLSSLRGHADSFPLDPESGQVGAGLATRRRFGRRVQAGRGELRREGERRVAGLERWHALLEDHGLRAGGAAARPPAAERGRLVPSPAPGQSPADRAAGQANVRLRREAPHSSPSRGAAWTTPPAIA